jgi:hypothetical protein
MPTQSKKIVKPMIKKQVATTKPVQKQKPALKTITSDGFTRINESTIRKVYR